MALERGFTKLKSKVTDKFKIENFDMNVNFGHDMQISNLVYLRHSLDKTLYELFKGRKPNINFFHSFESKCYILRPLKDGIRKFDARSDKGVFLGYSLTSKAYRVVNKRTLTFEESINVKVDDSLTDEEDAAVKAAGSSNEEFYKEKWQVSAEHIFDEDKTQIMNDSGVALSDSKNVQIDDKVPPLYKKRHPIN